PAGDFGGAGARQPAVSRRAISHALPTGRDTHVLIGGHEVGLAFIAPGGAALGQRIGVTEPQASQPAADHVDEPGEDRVLTERDRVHGDLTDHRGAADGQDRMGTAEVGRRADRDAAWTGGADDAVRDLDLDRVAADLVLAHLDRAHDRVLDQYAAVDVD